jgi:hypothetical protein
MLGPFQDIPAAIDGFLLTAEHLGHGFTQGSRALVEHQLEVRQSLLLVIEPDIAGVAPSFPLIRDEVALIGNAIPLVGDALALVGESLPRVLSRF